MPAVNISHVQNITVKQKRDLSKAITNAFVKIAGKDPNIVWIFWHGVDEENFARGGLLYKDSEKLKGKKK